MNLELILWVVAWILLSELIFIIWYAVRDEDYIKMDWGGIKFLSYVWSFLFMATQVIVVRLVSNPEPAYINLLYELAIILVIGLLILINWLIVKQIDYLKKKIKSKKTKKKHYRI